MQMDQLDAADAARGLHTGTAQVSHLYIAHLLVASSASTCPSSTTSCPGCSGIPLYSLLCSNRTRQHVQHKPQSKEMHQYSHTAHCDNYLLPEKTGQDTHVHNRQHNARTCLAA
jgi:hypothetical protein